MLANKYLSKDDFKLLPSHEFWHNMFIIKTF